jgi:hypothetical protein
MARECLHPRPSIGEVKKMVASHLGEGYYKLFKSAELIIAALKGLQNVVIILTQLSKLPNKVLVIPFPSSGHLSLEIGHLSLEISHLSLEFTGFQMRANLNCDSCQLLYEHCAMAYVEHGASVCNLLFCTDDGYFDSALMKDSPSQSFLGEHRHDFLDL